MDLPAIVEKAQGLSDIELAILLCFMAGQHCILRAPRDSLVSLREEVQLISSVVFGLSHTVIHCSKATTLDDFRDGLLVEVKPVEQETDVQGHGVGFSSDKKSRLDRSPILPSYGSSRHLGSPPEPEHHSQSIANIVILQDLSLASGDVQIQALELLRTRRIFTHTAVHNAPKMFVMVVLSTDSDPRLVKHLNDHIFISHHHPPQDGYPNLEEASEWIDDQASQSSQSSVLHRSTPTETKRSRGGAGTPILRPPEIHTLTTASKDTTTTAEMTAYIHNIPIFLRLHRAVAGGVTPKATQMLKILVNCLAPLHALPYATPSLVHLAARKIYAHRIVLGTPSQDRSLQYGGDVAGLKGFYEGLRAEDVIEEVLGEVEVPV